MSNMSSMRACVVSVISVRISATIYGSLLCIDFTHSRSYRLLMPLLESDQKVPTVDADVAVVRYGPVGMVVAALLGRRGHRVVVLERYGLIQPAAGRGVRR